MEMIKINLLDFNEELKKVQIQKQVVSAASILVLALVLIVFVWAWEQSKNSRLTGEISELDSQINALESQYRVVKKMQKKTKRTNQIIAGIEDLRANQTQPAKLLDNLNQLIPDEIWLERIRIMTKRDVKKSGVTFEFEGGSDEIIEIKGVATQTQAVPLYIERLKKTPYFKTVYLLRIKRETLGANQTWLFHIYCHRA